ncbi:MAG: DUF6804 family protein [Bacteroidales bacterium]
MKALLITCAGLLLLSIADLPIGYYTFLRIVVTIASIVVIVAELKNGLTFWIMAFGVMAILFNPLMPFYFNDKSVWIPIDIISAIIFLIKSFTLKQK